MGLEIVKCERKYWDFILELRNSLREGFIEQETITTKSHYEYMRTHCENYYIALEGEVPVGWVGEIDGDIRVATHSDHQKKGIAKFMINELMERHPDAFAKVKLNNEASIRLFESCGFKKKFYILEKEDA
jgi:ribosomal protein S18 acetylase RimI-like enzyme|tara:strand:- start:510 stop:899 length:390 start_codon:yes stop_codon:yes gene_type:complete